MAKHSSGGPEARKLTNKNMQYTLQLNVNDEVVQGFKTLQNVNVQAQSKAVVPRPALRQFTEFGYIKPSKFGIINFPTIQDATVTAGLPLSACIDGGIPVVDFVITSTANLQSNSLTILLTSNQTISNIPYTITTTISEFDPQQLVPGNVVATSVTNTNLNVLNTTTYTGIYIPLSTTISSAPNMLEGRSYLVSNSFSVNLNLSVEAYPGTLGLTQETQPTEATIYTFLNVCPVYQLTYYLYALLDLTNQYPKSCIYVPNFKSYMIAGAHNYPGQSFGFAELYTPNATNDQLLSYLLDNSGTLNTYSGYNCPAAFYGAKIERDVHTFGCFLGNQFGGRVVSTNPNGSINTGLTYPMFKIAKDDTMIVPVTGMVGQATGSVAVAVPQFIDDFVDPNDSPDGMPPGEAFGDAADVTLGNLGILGGIYNYAFEWVDITGQNYQPDVSNDTIINVQVNPDLYTSKRALSVPVTAMRRLSVVQITIPFPAYPYIGQPPNGKQSNYPILNVYRQTVRQTNTQSYIDPFSYTGVLITDEVDGAYQLIGSVDTSTNGPTVDGAMPYSITPNSVVITDEQRIPSGNTVLDIDYYIPQVGDFTLFKGKTIAIGDASYPNVIFPSRNYYTDFYVEDQYTVTFPIQDTFFTAIKVLGNFCFIFSPHATWRVAQVSTSAPIFQIYQVSDKLGCITGSRGITVVGDRMLVPTDEGLKWFDGSTWTTADDTLNNVWNQLDYTVHQLQTGGTPSLTVGASPAYDVQSEYDEYTKCVVYLMPAVSGGNRTIYVFNTTSGGWSTYDNPIGVTGIFVDTQSNRIGFITANSIYLLDKLAFKDSIGNGGSQDTVIPVILETTDFNFEELTTIKSLRLWGNGLCTVNTYMDRSDTPVSSFTNVDLDAQGTIGVELPQGWRGNYYRWKVTANSSDFVFKGHEIVYFNSGIKKFRQVAQ